MKKLSQTGLFQAGSFAVLGIIAKVVGVFYRIPLNNILGADGMGLYQTVFPIYTVLFVLCGGFITNAVARLIAASGEPYIRVLKSILPTVLGLGCFAALILCAVSGSIASAQTRPELKLCYLAIAPSLPLAGLNSALRGCFQGLRRLTFSGLSQVLSQGAKVGLGLVLAQILLARGYAYGAAGALIGVAISEAIASLYLWSRLAKFNVKPLFVDSRPLNGLRKSVLNFALPVTFGALITPAVQLAESFVIVRLGSTVLYGIYSGTAATLIGLPSLISGCLASAMMPAAAACLAQGLKPSIIYNRCLKCAAIIGCAFAGAFILLSKPIVTLLYGGALSGEQINIASRIISIEGITALIGSVAAIQGALLQSFDKAKLPVLAVLIGAAVKLSLLYPLYLKSGVYGAAMANVIGSAVTAVATCVFSYKHCKIGTRRPFDYLLISIVIALIAIAAKYMELALNPALGKGAILAALSVAAVLVLPLGVLIILKDRPKTRAHGH